MQLFPHPMSRTPWKNVNANTFTASNNYHAYTNSVVPSSSLTPFRPPTPTARDHAQLSLIKLSNIYSTSGAPISLTRKPRGGGGGGYPKYPESFTPPSFSPYQFNIPHSHYSSSTPTGRMKRRGGPVQAKPSSPPSNFLEPLVELRPTSGGVLKRLDKPYTDTYKQLQAQLAKSHKKSQKLNLIRNSENNSNYFPSFYEPTQAQILEAENRKNDALLQIYTDSGTFSKVVAMTVAASVLDAKLPHDVVQYPLDPKKREELMKFCHDVTTILNVSSVKVADTNDFRRLWHLFSIFTNAMDQRICTGGKCSTNTIDEQESISSQNNKYKSLGYIPQTRHRTLEEISSDGELIETIKTFNPNLYYALKDPLERFLIVYGRYVDVGHVKKSANLRNNGLNEYIRRYHERVAFHTPNPPLPLRGNHSTARRSKSGENKSFGGGYLDKTKGKENPPQSYSSHAKGAENGNDTPPSSGSKSSSASGDSSQDENDRKDDDLEGDLKDPDGRHSQHRKRVPKLVDESSLVYRNKKGPTPSWVQAYHKCKTICFDGCRYDVVRRIALENGFKEVGEHDVWNIIWTDVPISLEKALEMRRFQNAHAIFWGTTPPVQKANHFPGMNEICRKDRLACNLNRMKKCFPEDYNFFPRTWSLPADVADLLMYSRLRKNATYICKPDSGCQGKGIFLARNLKKLNPFAKLICQVYIPKPLLIDGYKFDLRIYILLTSCDPLRVYIYNEGIARFATVKYSPPNDQNIDVVYMHLTNYSLNKFSQSYDTHGDGSKRKMSTVFKTLADYGYDVIRLKNSIDAVAVKTVIAAQPTLRHYYRASFPKHEYGSACFEILGFDILIDRTLKPFLLEVNHSPSFNLDLPVDAEIKENLLKDTFDIIYMGGPGDEVCKPIKKGKAPSKVADLSKRVSRALQLQIQHEMTHSGNFRLIYPVENSQNYGDFFDQTSCPTMADFSLASKRKSDKF